MKIVSFPPAIKVDVLKKTNPEYNSKKLSMYRAMFDGGDAIHQDKMMDGLLPKRPIEATPEGMAQYKRRKEMAFYINRPNKLISWITASCFPTDPKIVTEPYSEYFDSLNEDADGLGTQFCTLSRNCLQEMLIGHRTYWHVCFPESGAEVSAADMEALSARLNVVPAEVVDDWSFDKDGRLEWTRSHNVELARDPQNPLAQASKERHTWTYHTDSQVAIYEFFCDIGGQYDPEAVAVLIPSNMEHDFQSPTLFDVRSPTSLWIMDKISDIVKALFRREAGITWALESQAYAIPVVTGQNSKIPSISGSELLALQLELGATLTFSCPPATIFDPLFKDAERLSKDLFEVCQAMSISAATIPQAGRLSSSAIESFKEPTITLLESFAKPIKESALRTLQAIAKYRGEDVKITLEGFDNPSEVTEDDLREVVMGKGENGQGNEDGAGDSNSDEEDGRDIRSASSSTKIGDTD